jgi:hypothetical protein
MGSASSARPHRPGFRRTRAAGASLPRASWRPHGEATAACPAADTLTASSATIKFKTITQEDHVVAALEVD